MTSMAAAIRQFVESSPHGVKSSDIKRYIDLNHPGTWEPTTLSTYLYACSVNQPKAYLHHKSTDKFLFKSADGQLHLYEEAKHGPNIWAPRVADPVDLEDSDIDIDASVEQLIEHSISFERDVEEHLIRNLDLVEKGLKYVNRQVSTPVGRVDIEAEDAHGGVVIIELKVGEATDAAVGQITRYLGWYARQEKCKRTTPPRGMLIASDFPSKIRYAAEAVRNLSLVRYRVQFAFNQVVVDE